MNRPWPHSKGGSGWDGLLVALTITMVAAACGSDRSSAESAGDPSTQSSSARGERPVSDQGYLTGAADARICYEVWGAGSDTVVAVHGGPGAGMNSLLPDMAPLADHFTVVFYDQRGGGRSELPADTALLRAEYFVEDLEAVRSHFGLERMKLFAHSFGSILVARYAREYPERLDRIVFHKGTGPSRDAARELARASQGASAPDSLAERRTALLRTLLTGEAADAAAACREFHALGRQIARSREEPRNWRATSCDAPSEAVAYYYRYTAQWAPRTFGAWDFTTGLDSVDAPLLVIHPSADSAAVAQQRAWASAVPNGRLLVVPEAERVAWQERQDLIIPAVVAFFEGRWPEGAEWP